MNNNSKEFIRKNFGKLTPEKMASSLNIPLNEVLAEIKRQNLGKKNTTESNLTLKPHFFTKWDYIFTAIVFFISLCLYVYTLSPGICAGDSGELTSAVFFLGNAHSPGYPLYCIVGKFFMNMLPFIGRAVYRLNFFSAFGGALTVAGLFLVLIKLFNRVWQQKEEEEPELKGRIREWLLVRIPAFAASLFLLFSDELWAQSVISEVYTLNSLFVPVFILILLKWDEMLETEPSLLNEHNYYWNKASKFLYAFYFLLAFSLGDHHIMLGVILPCFFFILTKYLKTKSSKLVILFVSIAYFSVVLETIQVKVPFFIIFLCLATAAIIILSKNAKFVFVHIIALFFIALGLFVYVYMPIRGHAYAPVHWGVPTTWERFSAVVLRKQYQGFAQAAELLSIKYRFMQFIIWLKWLINEFSLPVFLLGIPGLIHLWKRDRRVFWFTLSFIPYYVFGLLIFNNFKFTPRDEFFAEVFWIPFYVVYAIWLGYGVRFLILGALKFSQKIHLKKEYAGLACGVIMVLFSGFTFNKNFEDNNLRNNFENDNYGLNMLMTCEPNAILFTEGGDNQVFSLLYHHLVEHLRPDMQIWDQKGNVFEGLYGDLMRITTQQLAENQITGDYSQWATGRPIYYTWKDYNRINEINRRYYLSKGEPARGFVTTGILYRIQPENIPYNDRFDYWGHYKFLWEKIPEEARHWDYLAREIVANYNFQIGDRYLQEAEEFKNAYNNGLTSWKNIPRSKFIEKIDQLEEEGFKYYEKAAWFGFDMVAIHFNFGIFLEQKAIDHLRRGRTDKAIDYFNKAIEKYKNAVLTDREEIRAYLNLAAAYERLASVIETNETKYLSEAKKVLEKAKKISPSYPQLDGFLQRISNKLNFPNEKLNQLQEKINKNPSDRESVDQLVKGLISRGDLQPAVQFLENIIKYYPQDLNFLGTLASLNGQMGNLEKTVFYLEKMGKIQPFNAVIWYNIAEIYLKQQNIPKAVEYYKRTITTGQNNPAFQQQVQQARQRLQSLNVKP